MVDPDQLPDPKAAKVLKGFDIAEPGDWIQELDRCRGETFGKKAVLEKSVVPDTDHNRSLKEALVPGSRSSARLHPGSSALAKHG